MKNNKESVTPQSIHPQPVAQIKITAMSDGSANVNGFQTSLLLTLNIFFAGLQAVVVHFVKAAMKGEIDDNLTIIPKKIIEQDKRLVDGNGKPLTKQ